MTATGKSTISRPPIGGVFPLAVPSPETTPDSLLSSWGEGAAATHLFHNARSALNHILTTLAPPRLWLPAYLCPDILQAVPRDMDSHYYGLDDELRPDTEWLKAELRAGDAILGINYFGRPLPEDWHNLAKEMADLIWIEDCSQAILVDAGDFSGLRFYSPRKLIGAPDGGVLVDMAGILPVPVLEPITNDAFADPYRMRAADPSGDEHDAWYRAFRKAEECMTVSRHAISAISHRLLEATSTSLIAEQRKHNYRLLLDGLGDHVLFSEMPENWSPLGFPMRSDHAGLLGDYLTRHRVFAPRHWKNLPSPEDEFRSEHHLARTEITIPCDQRYGPEEMHYIIELIHGFRP